MTNYKDLIIELAKQVRFNETDEYYSSSEYQIIDQTEKTVVFEKLTKADVIKRLARKKKYNLTLLKPFVDILKYKTQTKKVSILSLSCTSKFWKNIYKNSRNVSRLLKIAQNVGLLKCIDDSYNFNAYFRKDNHSKLYAWNKEVEVILLALFKEYHIVYDKGIYEINYDNIISIVDTFKDDKKAKDYEELSRRFNIRIAQRTCLPLNDDVIVKGIVDKYPQYLEMLKTIEEDNGNKPLDEMDYANINIKRDKNKNAIKISIRKTNQYCPAKVHSLEQSDYESGRMIRDEIIKRKFGHVYENDVKSSIYRITKLLNTGIWEDNDIDLYESIYGSKFRSKDDRDIFKHPFCMQMYFNTSDASMRAHIEYKKSKTKMWMKKYDGLTLLIQARDNMFKAIGKSYYSEIFLHESCIYTQVAHKLRTLGYRVIQIYDGFFTDREIDEKVFNDIVKREALKYYRKYIKNKSDNNIKNKNNNNNNTYANINSGHIRGKDKLMNKSDNNIKNKNNNNNTYANINSGHIRGKDKLMNKISKDTIKKEQQQLEIIQKYINLGAIHLSLGKNIAKMLAINDKKLKEPRFGIAIEEYLSKNNSEIRFLFINGILKKYKDFAHTDEYRNIYKEMQYTSVLLK